MDVMAGGRGGLKDAMSHDVPDTLLQISIYLLSPEVGAI